jgi:hypothetical protein
MCFSERVLSGHGGARPARVPGADRAGVAAPGLPLALRALAPDRSVQGPREALPSLQTVPQQAGRSHL